MDRERWQRSVRGEECPLCAPRPATGEQWDLVAKLAVSSLYLAANQTYRGQCVLIFDPRHAARADELTQQEWAALCADLYAAQRAVVQAVNPDHLNVASLGNVVPHLHWHVVPRTFGDPRWGDPIWLTRLADMPDVRLAPGERAALLEALREGLR